MAVRRHVNCFAIYGFNAQFCFLCRFGSHDEKSNNVALVDGDEDKKRLTLNSSSNQMARNGRKRKMVGKPMKTRMKKAAARSGKKRVTSFKVVLDSDLHISLSNSL